MSALIFNLHPEQVVVATDTYAQGTDLEPAFFTSKAYYLPHLRMIIAGTGMGRVVAEWFMAINTGYLVSGVEELNDHAPSGLSALWGAFLQENPTNLTTTIYHFGVSEHTGKIASFVYRSASGFKSERFPDFGTGCKPPEGVPAFDALTIELIPEIMEAQRAAQAERDAADRIGIGGEIVLFSLTRDGFYSQVIHRFPDADDLERAMRARALRVHAGGA